MKRLIRQVAGHRDVTLPTNRELKRHLDVLKIPHSYRQAFGQNLTEHR